MYNFEYKTDIHYLFSEHIYFIGNKEYRVVLMPIFIECPLLIVRTCYNCVYKLTGNQWRENKGPIDL